MANRRAHGWCRALLLSAVSAFGVTATLSGIAVAQTNEAQEKTVSVDLPSGAMGPAMLALSEALGVNIIATDSMLAGKTAPAISGTYTAKEAIDLLLKNSGLSAAPNANRDFIVRLKSASIPEASAPSADQDAIPAGIEEAPLVSETIIVTGTKQGLSLQDTQASVALYTDTDIDERAIFDLADLALRTPNVSTAGSGASELSIRGINSTGVGNAGAGRTSNVYLDGAPLNANTLFGAFNLWDVNQVEILRGPQSTTQGRNALAGAVVLQSADPEYEFGAKARALVANDNTYQASGAITGPILKDQIAFRLAVDYIDRDFETFNAFLDEDEGDSSSLFLTGKLLIEPNVISNLRVDLTARYWDRDDSGNGTRSFAPPIGSPEEADFDPFDDITFNPRGGTTFLESSQIIADISYQFSKNWNGVVIATYEDIDFVSDEAIGRQDRTSETFSVDARANFDYRRVSGWIGGYYFHEDAVFTSASAFDPADFGSPLSPDGTTVNQLLLRGNTTENFAIYGDVLLQISDKLSLNIGARYDWEDVDDTGLDNMVSFSNNPCFLPTVLPFGTILTPCEVIFVGSDPVPNGAGYEAFLPRASIIHEFDEQRSISFSIQQGYRAGGFNALDATEFDPEFITNYEIAYRSVLLDDRLVLNANIFYADWADQQVSVLTTALEPRVINGGESELYGVEFSSRFKVTEEWAVSGNVGWVETEFTDFPFGVDANGNPLPGDQGFANLAGNDFTQAPQFTAAFGATYTGSNGVFGSIFTNFRSRQQSDITNLEVDETDSSLIVNGRIGFETDQYRISVFGQNILQEEYFVLTDLEEVVLVDNALVDQRPSVFRQLRLGAPRSFGVELEVSF